MEKLLGKVIDKVEESQARPGASPIGGFSHENDEDLRGAADHAATNANDNSDFFSSILNQIGSNKQQVAQESIDEQAAIRHHKEFYGGDGPNPSASSNPESATSNSMGSAAAMQALKLFTSGNLPGIGVAGSVPGQNTAQSAFIGLAMSQAAKLFDQQSSAGNLSSGASKESAVMRAGEMALSMYLQSRGDAAAVAGGKYGGGGIGAAGPGGDLGGLLGMARRFM